MTDQTKAVAALAEAMEEAAPKYKGETLVFWANIALQVITSNPDIRREYGIGRLPTRSELMACREVDASTGYPVRVFGDDAVDYLVEAGWAIEDPEPPAPELPSVREQVAANLYTANRHRKVDWSNLEGPSRLGWLNHADLLLKEFDITPKAAAEGDVSCG